MRCVIWAAVSSQAQAADEKDSIPSQIEAAREVIQRNEGWHEAADPLTIPGHSRSYIFLADAAADMPVYSQLMAMARQGQIDLLICRGRDRLGRTDALIAQIEEYLASYNIQILSLSMPGQVQDPDEYSRYRDRSSIWMRSVERARAQDEIAELRARHQMGMRRRIKEGYHSGILPFGYRPGEDGIGHPYGPEARLVPLIFDWYLAGQSCQQIARKLPDYATEKVPKTGRSVQYMIENPYYAGLVTYGRTTRDDWFTADGLHEALISLETWEAAQAEMARRRANGPRTPFTQYALSGMVICGLCGGSMQVAVTYDYRYYICVANGCRRNGIQVGALEEMVAEWMLYRAKHAEILEEEISQLWQSANRSDEREKTQLEQSLAQKRAALQRWTDDYESLLIGRSEYYNRRLELEEQVNRIEAQLEDSAEQPPDPEQISRSISGLVLPTIEETVQSWRQPDEAKRVKAALRRIGLEIHVRDRHAEIRFAL